MTDFLRTVYLEQVWIKFYALYNITETSLSETK